MKKFNCDRCKSDDVFINESKTQKGLYCSSCGKWIKWLSKSEYNSAKNYIDFLKNNNQKKMVESSEITSAIKFLKSINPSCNNCAVITITGECYEDCTVLEKNKYLNLAIEALEYQLNLK